MRQLVWFRTDLRVVDNPALTAAMAAGPTLALFVLTPAQWQQHDDAACKVDFWLRNLRELRRELERLHVPLLVRERPTWAELPSALGALCDEFAIAALHCNREVGVNETRRDHAVAERLAQQGVATTLHHGNSLLPPGSIRNQAGRCYQVFGQFRRAAVARLRTAPPAPLPCPAPQAPLAAIAADSLPTVVAGFAAPPAALREQWPAGEAAALARLRRFVDAGLADYHAARDFPARPGTSQLSPYLAAGVVSPRQCLWAALQAAGGEFDGDQVGASTWITELLWREFYRHLLDAYPRLSMGQPFQLATRSVRWREAPQELAAWQQGRTGIPIVDAAMRQLLATGWMHNRLRMVTAVFLTKNLLIDWREGERWFMRHLIDGDLAANNGGWQWSASTGTDAAPYFRVFNPVSQSRRFDPSGDFIRAWVPELAHLQGDTIHEPVAGEDLFAPPFAPPFASPFATGAYPPPIVDLKSSRVRAIEAFRALKTLPSDRD